jgi:hypothetical protein
MTTRTHGDRSALVLVLTHIVAPRENAKALLKRRFE